jgi:hypothetical protein
MLINEKTCSKCEILKPLDDFYKISGSEKHQNECKKCTSKRTNEFRKAHPERSKKYSKKYRQTHPEKRRETCQKYNAKHSDQHRKNIQMWRKKNPDKNRLWHRAWYKKTRSTNPAYRIEDALRARINKAVRGKLKTDNTLNLVGCGTDELIDYLSLNFSDGMSWDNYGEWHIDHIIPCAAFDLSIPKEQKKCFHYTNLQPLWAYENKSKGAKLDWMSS